MKRRQLLSQFLLVCKSVKCCILLTMIKIFEIICAAAHQTFNSEKLLTIQQIGWCVDSSFFRWIVLIHSLNDLNNYDKVCHKDSWSFVKMK